MARKSPRARKKAAPKPRLPGQRRSRATPGRARLKSRAGATATVARHKPKGARPSKNGRPSRRAVASLATTRVTKSTRRAKPGPKTKAPKPGARRRFQPPDPERVGAVLAGLEALYPDAHTELRFETPLQLLIATILSAQCTDERVNMVTPALFARFPDAAAFAAAPIGELEEMIRSTGFFRNKARAIQSCCADIVARFGGEVPRTLEELVSLHGVGRKTANVVLGNAYGIPGLVVDTHVTRLSNRLAFTNQKDAVKIEFAIMEIVPREKWTAFSHWLILHGRRVCIARKPRCSTCAIAPHCPRVGVAASQ